jgi:hypothetical protein
MVACVLIVGWKETGLNVERNKKSKMMFIQTVKSDMRRGISGLSKDRVEAATLVEVVLNRELKAAILTYFMDS